ncbi:hypothetical protein TWF696_005505 [Orbilia brochopaga]|uniref:Uncharacterized protein n=1 Tax=Orbilia brochopaga TaxID=3140254 RepID=A0AAV9V0Z5_9PEZI
MEQYKAGLAAELAEVTRNGRAHHETELAEWLHFGVHTSPETAYEFKQIRDILFDMGTSILSKGLPPPQGTALRQISELCVVLTSEWFDASHRWESASEALLEVSIHYRYVLWANTTLDVEKLKVHRKRIDSIIASSEGDHKQAILEATRSTLQQLDDLLRSLEASFHRTNTAGKLREQKLDSIAKKEEGLRRRRKAYTAPSDSGSKERPKDNRQSSTSSSSSNTGTSTGNLLFPSFFYPSPATTSLLHKILKSSDTIWFPVFILTVASGIFAGMAFFKPENSLFSTLSQMLRSYASLWCLLIPLFRDQTLPVWPTRGWLYGSVAASASLGVVGVVFCTVDGKWSGLISSIGDFSGLAATVLLAMGVVNSAAAHRP